MYHIQTLNKISPYGLEKFDRSKYICGDDVQNPDAVLVRSASMHDMQLGDNLKAIARAGAGVNNIPIDRCSQQGIVVFNTPGANANAVKELVMCGLLMSARKVYPAMDWVQTIKGEGDAVPKLVEKGKAQFSGPELSGKKLGVIGLGAIGILVANFARHFGMQVYGYDPYMSVETAWKVSRDIKHAISLQEIYENCDFITLHVPLTPETKEMINSESIKMMKHGVRILNFARGELVSTKDIKDAIDEKQVRCYVTDFPSDELLGHPGVLAIPHLGASTPESEDNCAKMAAEELIDYLENGNITNSVNLPNVIINRNCKTRVTVIHKNIPQMITAIAGVFGDCGVNIENLTNKSKKEYAYTVVDTNGDASEDAISKLKAIDGVIRVNIYR
ncbi:phosphoglycerate dehydrogenase [Youxingia wuxianensis]|uniref:D-3-phosphoglycerate dehydrogenase n=1 Tax=Youxingia wuxianensis TaxID=2763678 RepID=A0A926ID48_9FIRM|nr:phosphoglycerate dehydrogenase [Youxingia wuxianensis]MBC8585897.1 phosphoglycerate dehydrogenase [Youxingia wuxianensis]